MKFASLPFHYSAMWVMIGVYILILQFETENHIPVKSFFVLGQGLLNEATIASLEQV